MSEKFPIHLEIAGKTYGLWINRNEAEEQLAREAAKQIKSMMLEYGNVFSSSVVDVKDYLAMVALQLSMQNIEMKQLKDETPMTEAICSLSKELEEYLKK